MRKVLALLVVGTAAAGAAAADPPPTIQLLPLTVQEDIGNTNRAARAIEGELRSLIDQLDDQYTTFITAQCDGLTRDEGCQQLTEAMAASYDELLAALEVALPDLKQPLMQLRDELQARVRHELGLRRTPRELQALLLAEGVSENAASELRPRNRRSLTDGVRTLSSLLPRLTSAATGTVAASEFYLDAAEAVKAIEFIEGKIPYARAQLALAQAWGGVDETVIEGVRGFSDLYFGSEDEPLRPDRPLELVERELPDPAISELTQW